MLKSCTCLRDRARSGVSHAAVQAGQTNRRRPDHPDGLQRPRAAHGIAVGPIMPRFEQTGRHGVALGVAFYRVADADLLRLLIGAIAIGFVLWQVLVRGGVIRGARRALPGWAGMLAGMVAGFTSFVSHAGGPPAAVYLLSRGIDKTRYQATTVILFFVLNIAKAVPYAVLGLFTAQTLLIDLALAPFALLGAWIGVRAHRIVPERAFFGITYVLLAMTGAKLILDGL